MYLDGSARFLRWVESASDLSVGVAVQAESVLQNPGSLCQLSWPQKGLDLCNGVEGTEYGDRRRDVRGRFSPCVSAVEDEFAAFHRIPSMFWPTRIS
jgi:hypothetical protein